jgi:hypothetical protein
MNSSFQTDMRVGWRYVIPARQLCRNTLFCHDKQAIAQASA